ncbi:hypothetical protein [Exiguobacterium acetylicum]|uniref:hypothetical protein n=1 Tax=Exiguobacterium acetylicum TaxID=41170 RepID=UPI003019ED56
MNFNVSLKTDLITLFSISLLLNILLIIICFLIFKANKESSDTSKNINSSQIISKRDLVYWFIFILSFSILNFTYYYKDQNEVISHWSFAGTIISIILAIIAILFTLYQTFSGDLSSQKVSQATEKLDELTNKVNIDVVKESVDNMSKASTLLEVAVKGFKYHEEMLEKMNISLISLTEIKEDTSSNYLTNLNTSAENNDSVERDKYITEENLHKYLSNDFKSLPSYPKLFFYCRLIFIKSFNDKPLKKDNSKKLLKLIQEIIYDFRLASLPQHDLTQSTKDNLKVTTYSGVLGSFGAVNGIFKSLGFDELFLSLDEEKQQELILLCKDQIHSNFQEILVKFEKQIVTMDFDS